MIFAFLLLQLVQYNVEGKHFLVETNGKHLLVETKDKKNIIGRGQNFERKNSVSPLDSSLNFSSKGWGQIVKLKKKQEVLVRFG